jgi:hypothetical protein
MSECQAIGMPDWDLVTMWEACCKLAEMSMVWTAVGFLQCGRSERLGVASSHELVLGRFRCMRLVGARIIRC